MFLGVKQIVMVQYFPATGNYIVHYQGAESEHFVSDADIHNHDISAFIAECLRDHNYHESTIHMHTSQIAGKNTVPLRQIIYCRSFISKDQETKGQGGSDINWVLWVPASKKLTVNSGALSASKDFMIETLEDAPPGVVSFMEACTEGHLVALSDHHCEPDYSGPEVTMNNVDEYFFSTGKIIYGFQHNRVGPFTKEDAAAIGISWNGN